jgi:DNA-directed RNA polymerase specialized sigma24 family protein
MTEFLTEASSVQPPVMEVDAPGDQEAHLTVAGLAHIYAEQRTKIVRIVGRRRQMWGPFDAEDAVQDAFVATLAVVQNDDRAPIALESGEAYIIRTALNRASYLTGSPANRATVMGLYDTIERMPTLDVADPRDSLADAELADMWAYMGLHVGDDRLKILSLVAVHGYSYAEAGTIMGISWLNARHLYYSTLKKVRNIPGLKNGD